jgi:lipocalin
MNYIESLKSHSLHLSCFLTCKLYNISIPFHSNINNMFRDEIIQYWIDNCNLMDCYRIQSKYITWEIVQANPNKYWDYGKLSSNPNITREIVRANQYDNPERNWDYDYLSRNPNITWEIVQANPDNPWSYDRLSRNPNITWEIVQANPNDNPNDNPNKKWDYEYLSQNPNITWEIVQANPNKPWNYYELSENPNITWEIVQANQNDDPETGWDYIEIILRLLYKK